VIGRADRWIRHSTIGCVGMLALIAGTVSYLHMHLLVELHGQPGWVAALTPLSVDGMIAAASTPLLAESRCCRHQLRLRSRCSRELRAGMASHCQRQPKLGQLAACRALFSFQLLPTRITHQLLRALDDS
jgi:Protein of unknown function (DUF2637)